ncbi:predicted protein [Sclerotinia sclerotiorum 1980 UF-70]|uniref:Uncharacterized protein n=1 Tax=Sclerotinia sclerotiorum (strain ATCC 18683 / 1980 / Ss-1) TaxID=665079 RepID=A7EGE5_SCLS1|nr:predicted protein [Sclerotinia sclerotiorum 1980 UF-70]EDO01911.1 predicted protein [Sclerotinia sclerotiorum 1980 UF-70]
MKNNYATALKEKLLEGRGLENEVLGKLIEKIEILERGWT